ncbi:MAG: nucleotide exchange factor GrpE [Tannerella sp.]|jgi:molecular chaperone GrpE|nr:nucleotide exchange factor GrpE [Tannerella sp.]
MSNKNKQVKPEMKPDTEANEETKLQDELENMSADTAKADNLAEDADRAEEPAETENREGKYSELNDSYLRLMAEFDNYRKRTLREKAELIKSGGETVLINLLPVIDDFERALSNIRQTEDLTAVVQGIELIYGKFTAYLSQQGVRPIEAIGKPFDTEHFEAIATVPAPDDEQKGKVLDCIQTGYVLHEKVIRHAKVVVGE